MAIIGHVFIGAAVGRIFHERSGVALLPSMVAGAFLATLPDLDFVGLHVTTRGSDWAHRGFTHSLAFALALGGLIGIIAGRCGLPRRATVIFAACAIASHGLVDTLTDTANGPALLWPFSSERFVAPLRPILVAPLGLDYFGSAGMRALTRELVLFWPLALYAFYPRRRAPASDPALGSPPELR
jgi:inner membrane protein